jgi:predicted xylose isomerase-like sugar epimerase
MARGVWGCPSTLPPRHTRGIKITFHRRNKNDTNWCNWCPQDVMSNQAQISALEGRGYTGFYSFEPFSPQVQTMTEEELSTALDESIELIQCLA